MSDAPTAPPIPDGTYDVFIVDAVPHPDRPESVVKVEVTIVSGEFKGEVLNLSANGIRNAHTNGNTDVHACPDRHEHLPALPHPISGRPNVCSCRRLGRVAD